MFSSICLDTVWQCTSLIFTCEVDWKISDKTYWKYANSLNLKSCGELLNSRKLLGENGLFDCKVSDYLWPKWERTIKPDGFIMNMTF